MKFNLHNFQSITRAALMIGGTVAAIKPEYGHTVQQVGEIAASIGVIWGQVNAITHPHNPEDKK